MLNGIWLAFLGVLAVPSLILSKRPDAKDLLAKLAPYQGWIGVISALWGMWSIISCVLNLRWLSVVPIFWLTWLANSVLLVCLGLILGIGTFKTFIKDPTAQGRLDEILAKLAPHQGQLGIAAVVLGIWMIVSSLLWRFAM